MALNVLFLFGGKSGEHEVSCLSVASVLENIHTDKYTIIKVGITKEGVWYKTEASAAQIADGTWETLANERAILSPDTKDHGLLCAGKCMRVDVVFPVMHGTHCEDGCIQGLFELAGIPYVGAHVLASAVGMHKGMAKLAFSNADLPQVPWMIIHKAELAQAQVKIEAQFTYPLFVKPAEGGSSLGAAKVKDAASLATALQNAAQYGDDILVEDYIDCRELECAILGNEDPKASCVGEIVAGAEFYDYDAKYVDNTSRLIIPADIEAAVSEQIRAYAVRAFQAVGASGFSRVDFFMDKVTGKVYLNEINTLPGFTKISMYPKLWQASGIAYADLIDRLIELA